MSDEQQPVAWAALWPDDGDGVDCNWIYDSREDAEWAAAGGEHIDGRWGTGTVVPLYREPKPALTDEEREAGGLIVMHLDYAGRDHLAATLRGLLERLGGER